MEELQNIQNLIYVVRGQRVMLDFLRCQNVTSSWGGSRYNASSNQKKTMKRIKRKRNKTYPVAMTAYIFVFIVLCLRLTFLEAAGM